MAADADAPKMSDEELQAYQLGHDHGSAGLPANPSAVNPFAGKTDFSDLSSATAAAGGPGAVASLPRTPASSGGRGYNEIVSPVATPSNPSGAGGAVQPQKYPAPGSAAPVTATAPVQSKAPTVAPQHQWDSAWTDGDFKSAGARLSDMMNGTGAYTPTGAKPQLLASWPRTPQSPVGGTTAVVDQDTGANGNSRTNVLSRVNLMRPPAPPKPVMPPVAGFPRKRNQTAFAGRGRLF